MNTYYFEEKSKQEFRNLQHGRKFRLLCSVVVAINFLFILAAVFHARLLCLQRQLSAFSLQSN